MSRMDCRILALKCTYCGKVGLEEDTCFKEKTKEGGRQRDIVCYTYDKSRHIARRCPNNVALWRERWCPLPGNSTSVLYPLAEEVEVHCI